jgi:hypothetical protein
MFVAQSLLCGFGEGFDGLCVKRCAARRGKGVARSFCVGAGLVALRFEARDALLEPVVV